MDDAIVQWNLQVCEIPGAIKAEKRAIDVRKNQVKNMAATKNAKRDGPKKKRSYPSPVSDEEEANTKKSVKNKKPKGRMPAHTLEPHSLAQLADDTLRKPDLLLAKGDTLAVCDITLVWKGPNPLTLAYHQKVAYYNQQPILDEINSRYPGKDAVVLALVLGAWAEQKTLLINQNELNALDVLAANSDNNLRLLLDIKPANNLASATDIVIRHYHNEQRIRTLSQNLIHHTQKPNEIHSRKPPVNRSQSNYFPTYKPVYPTHVSMAPRFNSYIPPNPNFYQRPAYQQQYVRPSIPKAQFPSQPIPIQTRPANNQRFFTNQQVFGKPKTPSNVFSPRNSNKWFA
ncbi:hypothetical protein Trydic_g17523 [Trypoxylus dichotomus]